MKFLLQLRYGSIAEVLDGVSENLIIENGMTATRLLNGQIVCPCRQAGLGALLLVTNGDFRNRNLLLSGDESEKRIVACVPNPVIAVSR
jgi:hypothetical protein